MSNETQDLFENSTPPKKQLLTGRLKKISNRQWARELREQARIAAERTRYEAVIAEARAKGWTHRG